MAFGCLFIGSGKQKVYQSLVNLSKVDYNDKKKKSNFWMIGVFFYSVAWPLVLASNFLYFVDLGALSNKLSIKVKTKLPFLNIRNQSVRQDIEDQIEIFFEKNLSRLPESQWREQIVMYATLVPLVCLCLDMMINKIKIKIGHYWFVVSINVLYFFYTMFVQWKQNTPVYLENLNWYCA
jgi:hypothetical protein